MPLHNDVLVSGGGLVKGGGGGGGGNSGGGSWGNKYDPNCSLCNNNSNVNDGTAASIKTT